MEQNGTLFLLGGGTRRGEQGVVGGSGGSSPKKGMPYFKGSFLPVLPLYYSENIST